MTSERRAKGGWKREVERGKEETKERTGGQSSRKVHQARKGTHRT